MTMSKNYVNITLNSLPERELEIIGTITAEKMALMRQKALAKIKADFETDGFRKGNVPEAIIVQKIGEMGLLEEAAEIALSEEYPNILEEYSIDAIGRPEINITKIGVGTPLEFKIKTALLPEVKLVDYKKIAKKENAKETKAPEVSDKEIENVIENIQQSIAHEKIHTAKPPASADDRPTQTVSGFRENGGGEKHNHRKIEEADLPAVDDDFAKMIGGFKDVADMKEKIRENILIDKTKTESDKKRTAVLEEIMKESKIDLPKIIIEGEMEKMLAQFKDDIGKSGVAFDEYLKHIKKTEDNLKLEWQDVAVKRAKSQVILNTIAKNEGVVPPEEDVKKEMENILTHHKDAERFRVRMYVETFLTNELVFQFLEKQV